MLVLMIFSDSSYSIIMGIRKTGLIASNNPHPEKVLGIREISIDVHCASRSWTAKFFELLSSMSEILKRIANSKYFQILGGWNLPKKTIAFSKRVPLP